MIPKLPTDSLLKGNWTSPFIKAGPWAILAAFLIWQLVKGIPAILANQVEIKAAQAQVEVKIEKVQETLESKQERMDDVVTSQEKLLRGVCMGVWEGSNENQLRYCN